MERSRTAETFTTWVMLGLWQAGARFSLIFYLFGFETVHFGVWGSELDFH
jgi:hypothetical protein